SLCLQDGGPDRRLAGDEQDVALRSPEAEVHGARQVDLADQLVDGEGGVGDAHGSQALDRRRRYITPERPTPSGASGARAGIRPPVSSARPASGNSSTD